MNDSPAKPVSPDSGGVRDDTDAAGTGKKRSKSMHDGVPVWHDCCSCEAEPYWTEAAEAPEGGPVGDDK
jgi:hypothetical protein